MKAIILLFASKVKRRKESINFIGDEFFAATPSGTGYQISFFGVFGILVGKAEGVEINIAGLVFGFDPMDLQLKLPMLGEVNLL